MYFSCLPFKYVPCCCCKSTVIPLQIIWEVYGAFLDVCLILTFWENNKEKNGLLENTIIILYCHFPKDFSKKHIPYSCRLIPGNLIDHRSISDKRVGCSKYIHISILSWRHGIKYIPLGHQQTHTRHTCSFLPLRLRYIYIFFLNH
jgi:hypothetical protein